jgi:hypothetical protein
MLVFLGVSSIAFSGTQDGEGADTPKVEPRYTETFSGIIVELSDTQLTVSRSILGKPPENRTFTIRPDTRVEGKLRVKLKVTVGFVTTTDGDWAKLIVARPQKPAPKK